MTGDAVSRNSVSSPRAAGDGRACRVAASRRSVCLGVHLLLALGWAALAAAETDLYRLDPDHTSIAFRVEHVGFSRVLGWFGNKSGSFRYDDDSGRVHAVEIRVDTGSVLTGVEARDRHLRSDDFLACERFPEMVFSAVEGDRLGDDGQVELTGSLRLRGVERPLTLHLQRNRAAPSPMADGRFVVGISASGRLRRSDFGIDYGLADGLVGDVVEILIEAEAQRQ